eukprot:tig00001368_g8400.t1
MLRLQRWGEMPRNVARDLVSRETRGRGTTGITISALARLEPAGALCGHAGSVGALNFSPTGALLASGSDDLRIKIWDVEGRRLVHSLDTRHTADIASVEFLSDEQLVSGGADWKVHAYDVQRHVLRRWQCCRGRVRVVSARPEEPSLVLCGGEEGAIRQFDLRERHSCEGEGASCGNVLVDLRNRSRHTLGARNKLAVFSIARHPLDPHRFAVGAGDAVVRVFDARALRLAPEHERPDEPVAHYVPRSSAASPSPRAPGPAPAPPPSSSPPHRRRRAGRGQLSVSGVGYSWSGRTCSPRTAGSTRTASTPPATAGRGPRAAPAGPAPPRPGGSPPEEDGPEAGPSAAPGGEAAAEASEAAAGEAPPEAAAAAAAEGGGAARGEDADQEPEPPPPHGWGGRRGPGRRGRRWRRIFVWERRGGRVAALLRGDEECVFRLRPHPRELLLASGGMEHAVRLWAPGPGAGEPEGPAWGPDPQLLADLACANQREVPAPPRPALPRPALPHRRPPLNAGGPAQRESFGLPSSSRLLGPSRAPPRPPRRPRRRGGAVAAGSDRVTRAGRHAPGPRARLREPSA